MKKILTESRIALFFRINWIIFVVVIIINSISSTYFDIQSNKKFDKILKEIKKNSDYVIMTRIDGHPIKVQKTEIELDSNAFISYLAYIGKNFIVDKKTITKGYTEIIKTPIDVFKYSKSLTYIVNNFFPKDKNDNLKIEPLINYSSPILASLNLRELPETIVFSKTIDYDYVPDFINQTFKVTFKYECIVTDYNEKTTKYEEHRAIIPVFIQGLFNPYDYSTIENPYGLIIQATVKLPKSKV